MEPSMSDWLPTEQLSAPDKRGGWWLQEGNEKGTRARGDGRRRGGKRTAKACLRTVWRAYKEGASSAHDRVCVDAHTNTISAPGALLCVPAH
eukprot:364503-Chlamydomonas_euryale.AAC.2